MRTKAFTLIELAVVLLVIGVLSGIVLRNIGSQGVQARDTKRISDLRNVSVYLSQYMSKIGQFPTANDLTWSATSPLSTALQTAGVITAGLLPTKPPSGSGSYEYYACSDQGAPPGAVVNHYVLRVVLEEKTTENPQIWEGALNGTLPSGWNCGATPPTCSQAATAREYCLAN